MNLLLFDERKAMNAHPQAQTQPWNVEQDTMPLPAMPHHMENQIAVQPDYKMMKTLAELSGLRLLVVYRLLRVGADVSRPADADAWERLLQAREEMQRRELVRRLQKQVFHE
jgi:hypothetical protein